jgi:hypothetical protein
VEAFENSRHRDDQGTAGVLCLYKFFSCLPNVVLEITMHEIDEIMYKHKTKSTTAAEFNLVYFSIVGFMNCTRRPMDKRAVG